MAIVVKINQFLLAAVILGNVQLIAMDLNISLVDMCKKKLIKEAQELSEKERVLGEITNSLMEYRNKVNSINDNKHLMSELGYGTFGMQVMQGFLVYKALLDKQNKRCLDSREKVAAIRNNLSIFKGCADKLNEKKRQDKLLKYKNDQRGKKRKLDTVNVGFREQKRRLMNDKSINTLL